MKFDVKQKLVEAKDFTKKHARAVLGTTMVIGTAVIALLYTKNHKTAPARRAELEAS